MLNHLQRMRNQGGEVVGLPFVDATAAAFQALLGATTDIVFTLPAAAGATDVPPGLVVNAAGPPVVPGDCVVGAIRIDAAALDANITIQQCWVSTAGGPGVGQITARVLNTTAGNIPGAPAARTLRFFLLR